MDMMVKLKYVGPKAKMSIPLPVGMKNKMGVSNVISVEESKPYFELDEKNAVRLLAHEEKVYAEHGHRNFMLAEEADAEEAAKKAADEARKAALSRKKPAQEKQG